MAGKPKQLSKTDLRRGLYTKPEAAPAVFPGATSADEQALLFDLTAFDNTSKSRTAKKVMAVK